MKDVFGKDKNSKHNVSGLMGGGYATMIKKRKETLPEIEDTIRDVLSTYEGQSICIVVQNEDENGLPDNHQIFMGGVSRMECQISLAKALDQASHQAMEVLMESANGNVKAMLQIAAALVSDIEEDVKKKGKK